MTTSNPNAPRQYDRDYYQSQLIAKAIKDEPFRKALVNDPKAILAREFGVEIPDNIKITVLQEETDHYYLVIPAARPSAPSELRDEELEAVVGGKSEPKPTTEPAPSPEPTRECCGFCMGTTTTGPEDYK